MTQNNPNKTDFLQGMRDGLPIGLGYYAVAFSLGIIAKKAGLVPIEGFFSSLFTRASAGEYGGYTTILANAPYFEMFAISVVANLRYLLMNTALTQKFSPTLPLYKRLLVGVCCTDEIFGISIAYKGYLNPIYPWAATLVAGPMWALGTMSGIIAGSVLPANLVSALGVALYGMFLAIITPVAKKDHAVLAVVLASFACSFACQYLPLLCSLSSGTRTILLTILLSAAAAILHPVNTEE